MMRNISVGLAICLVAAAVISYVVNFDRIEGTTAILGAVGFGIGVFSIAIGRAARRR